MMDITAIENELQALLSLTNRWGEFGHTTNIEKDIALSRVRALYDAILAVETTAAPVVAEVVADVAVEKGGEQDFVGDESFEEQPYGDNSYGEELSCESIAEDEQPEPQQQDGEDEGEEQGDEEEGDSEEEEEEEEDGEEESKEDEEDEEEQGEDEKTKQSSLNEFRKEVELEREQRFIHDLFCNDANFYHHELSKIEQLDNLDDVLIYIGQKYTWSPDNISAQQFVELQASRFGL